MKSLAIQVYGRVQGVGFRYYTRNKANEYNIKGFVKNALDGSVYIEAEGTDDAIEALIIWLKKGPPLARVDSIQAYDIPSQRFINFLIR